MAERRSHACKQALAITLQLLRSRCLGAPFVEQRFHAAKVHAKYMLTAADLLFRVIGTVSEPAAAVNNGA